MAVRRRTKSAIEAGGEVLLPGQKPDQSLAKFNCSPSLAAGCVCFVEVAPPDEHCERENLIRVPGHLVAGRS